MKEVHEMDFPIRVDELHTDLFKYRVSRSRLKVFLFLQEVSTFRQGLFLEFFTIPAG